MTKDSGIESLEDLVGKHISVGAAGSTTVDEATVHLSLLGKTLDDLKAEYMGTSESADAISNKQLDGVWVMAGTPNAAVTQIMTTTDAKILPIPAETVEALQGQLSVVRELHHPGRHLRRSGRGCADLRREAHPVHQRRCG